MRHCARRAGILFYGMRWQTIACRLIGAFAALGAVTLAGPGFALQLITKAEAALPSARAVGGDRLAAADRGHRDVAARTEIEIRRPRWRPDQRRFGGFDLSESTCRR